MGRIVAKLELPQLTRHGLRHTGATWMTDSGIPLHVLQKILGHKSIETTEDTSTRTCATSPRRTRSSQTAPSTRNAAGPT
ncbi:MAG: tyrosine-type recombinase/integrase [Actinomycetales bacterium]